jgi:hypothetical protein
VLGLELPGANRNAGQGEPSIEVGDGEEVRVGNPHDDALETGLVGLIEDGSGEHAGLRRRRGRYRKVREEREDCGDRPERARGHAGRRLPRSFTLSFRVAASQVPVAGIETVKGSPLERAG